jgi:farnesyl-diphosphate farnesyltransferase
LKANVSPKLFALLKGTSRSFYISLRFLPAQIRTTLSLAYLLARASDTIADSNKMAADGRLQALGQLEQQIASGGTSIDLKQCIESQPDGAEKSLLNHVQFILVELGRLPQSHRALIVEVSQKIIRGQTLDIERFELRKGVQALQNSESLDEYTYLVAGCVGEFWTKLCRLEWRDYSKAQEADLLRKGINFGKALQLINIVRDYPTDLQNGRSYLPVSDPEAVAANPELARSEWETAREQALRYLVDGWRYVIGIRPPRVRFACAVPLFIGIRTLQLLGHEREIRSGVKVSRREVRKLLLLSAIVGWLPVLEGWAYGRVLRARS